MADVAVGVRLTGDSSGAVKSMALPRGELPPASSDHRDRREAVDNLLIERAAGCDCDNLNLAGRHGYVNAH